MPPFLLASDSHNMTSFSFSAIRESMGDGSESEQNPTTGTQIDTTSYDMMEDNYDDLQLAMALSQQHQEEDERLRKQEEEELEMIIALSLTEK